jgi:hypothetical protein
MLVCDDDFWARDAAVRFRHVDTGFYLHMVYIFYPVSVSCSKLTP